MTAIWSVEALEQIDAADELEIAVTRADSTTRRWTPIWVVCADDQVFVRTWHRRETGWFGDVVDSGLARIRVPGHEADVSVDDIGAASASLRATIDDAYRAKYGRYGRSTVERMVAAEAAAATLQLRLRAAGGPTCSGPPART